MEKNDTIIELQPLNTIEEEEKRLKRAAKETREIEKYWEDKIQRIEDSCMAANEIKKKRPKKKGMLRHIPHSVPSAMKSFSSEYSELNRKDGAASRKRNGSSKKKRPIATKKSVRVIYTPVGGANKWHK